ncbi:MAG: MraY family glycosyltransferase [Candidatus Contendobacter sp.]|nr:MraY family glycosyltransferase [Candidatus Contendobacter sp.]
MESIARIVGPLLLAFGVCVVLIALLIRPARSWGWVDRPAGRKHHPTPVPLVGGVAMCIAYGLGLLALPARPEACQALLIAMVLLTLIGLYDDLRAARPTIRFVFQGGAVLIMALGGGVTLDNLGDLFGLGNVTLPKGVALLFTVFCVVGVINAFNMIDGLDGLAGGLALIAAGWLIVLLRNAPLAHAGDHNALLALIMVIAGFLCFNLRHRWRSRASVFMGDAGSTMLGFVLAWFLVHLSQGQEAVMRPMTAVWLLALPLMDTISVMIRRACIGHNPFVADRRHLHHLLLSVGLSDGRATALLLIAALLVGAVGVVAYELGVPEYYQFYAFLALFGLYHGLTTHFWRRYSQPVAPLAETGATKPREVPRAASVATPAAFPSKPTGNGK